MRSTTTPDSELITELVRRIVHAAHPLRVVLFGSAARGQMGPNSDLDVLVVVPNGTSARDAEISIYQALWGFGFATDVIAVTEDDVGKYGANPYLVIHTALTQGKEIYRATG